MHITAEQVINQLKASASPMYLQGMTRFGIDNTRALGVKLPLLRKLAKSINKNHMLALQLWETGIHEAMILATLIAEPARVTPELMDNWVAGFYSWDICDQVCGNLFDRTAFAVEKAFEYSSHESEFIKRAGFVLMAEYAVHAKKADDSVFLTFMPIIEREAWDDRNFVKKAVNWALRQIGKRNTLLCKAAIATAERIALQPHKAARWIARNALRELAERDKIVRADV